MTIDETPIWYKKHLLIPRMATILADEIGYDSFNPNKHYCRIPVIGKDWEILSAGFEKLNEIRTIIAEMSHTQSPTSQLAPCQHNEDECLLAAYKTRRATATDTENIIHLEGIPYVKEEDADDCDNQLIFPHLLDRTTYEGTCVEYALTPENWNTVYTSLVALTNYVTACDFPTYTIPAR